MQLRGYRGERVLVTLIASAALAVVNAPVEAISRVGLADALLSGRVSIDAYGERTIDRALYKGRYYTDKAPGLSALATVPVGVLEAADPTIVEAGSERLWNPEGSLWLWAIRIAVGGPFFVLGVVLVGRLAEGFARGTGALASVAYGLGTLAHPLGPTLFGHIPAGTLGLAALLLVGRQRPQLLAAGGCLGAAVLIEYQAAVLAAAILMYALWLRGPRAAAVVAAGCLPGAALLGLYNLAAFGSPLRLSYRYVDNVYAAGQSRGFFGIGLPDMGSLVTILVGERGLLLLSPVVALAAAGLWLLARRGFPREAAVAAALTVTFLVVNAGYFLPYGGVSPGPRFFSTCLPLLALGFGPAFARWPRAGYIVTTISVLGLTAASLAWSFAAEDESLVPSHANLAKTIWMAVAGDNRIGGALLTAALTVAALAVAASAQRPWQTRRARPIRS